MQFSIQRPTLPSTETHPEEKLYRRLDVTTWLRHLNHNGQVEEEYKLRKVVFCMWGGECTCSYYPVGSVRKKETVKGFTREI